jgi:tetratricopeptide (TPR) repeat protein
MKNMKQYMALSAALLLLAACTGTPPAVGNLVSLADAVAGAAASVEEKAPDGGTVAVVKINSPLTALSDFLAGELENRFTASEKLTVLVRGEHLAGVNAEQQFQMSGMVSDENAAGIGRFLGAQVVITGDFTRFANFSQLALRAVEVETARLLTAYTAKIAPGDPVLAGIMAPLGPAQGRAVSEAELEQLNLAKDYIAAGIYGIALEELNRLIAKNPNFAEARIWRGNVYSYNSDGFNDEKYWAIADYTEAIRLDPNNAGYYITRGLIYGDDDRAIADYTRAIRLDPNNADGHIRRGRLYHYREEYYRAIADFTEAIRLDPAHNYYSERAISYIERGDYDHAIADYTEAIRVFPPVSDSGLAWTLATKYAARAQIYEKISQYDHAIADYTEAIRLIPNHFASISYCFARGKLYAQKGDYDRAITDYEQVLRTNPNNDIVIDALEDIRRARGR